MAPKTRTAQFDAVVVGTGAGGAVVAKELAEGGLRVALIEEGAYFKTPTHIDQAYRAVRRLYRDQGFTTTLGKPAMPVPLGRAVGGTTLVNSGTCFRTPDTLLKRWQTERGLHELTTERFAPLFDKVEREIHVEESRFEVMGESNRLVHELLKRRGLTGHPLRRNIIHCDGCGFCCYGCPSGAKQSTEISYVPKALKAGAELFTRCRIDHILTEGHKAMGVEGKFLDSRLKPTGEIIKIFAPHTIIAAGSLLTPLLLKKNGIARGNKNLGRHLTVHPATKVFAQFDRELKSWEGTPQAYYYNGHASEGFVLEGIFVPPDIAALTVPFVGRKLLEFMEHYRNTASFGFMVTDTGSGRVMQLPLIGRAIFYDLHPQDVIKMQKASAFLAELFLEGGAKAVHPLIHGHYTIQSKTDVERLRNARLKPEDIECMAFHPLGTCRMSPSPKTGVVDPNFKVHGWEGLYIADGSIIPSALGVNPQVTIMAFATLCANKILEKS